MITPSGNIWKLEENIFPEIFAISKGKEKKQN